jgi:hypothetical protein
VEEIESGEFHEANLIVHAGLRLEEVGANVGEGGGAFGGDAIGGEGLEEITKNVIDVDLREEIAGGGGEFFGEIALAGVREFGGVEV